MTATKLSDMNTVKQRIHSVERLAISLLPTQFGQFSAYGYREMTTGLEHVALVHGSLPLANPSLVRIHSECLTGEAFGSSRCDCGDQLNLALTRIGAEGGALIYLRGQEGRGIGLVNKIRAYALQDTGRDTAAANTDLGLPVDARDYGVAFSILSDLGIRSLRLMTNNPDKIRAAETAGFPVIERIPSLSAVTQDNARYMHAKAHIFGHLLPEQ